MSSVKNNDHLLNSNWNGWSFCIISCDLCTLSFICFILYAEHVHKAKVGAFVIALITPFFQRVAKHS